MQHFLIENRDRQVTLADTAALANRPWTRMRGLLGRAELHPGAGLIIRPCQGVHTWFMQFAIDVLYVDRHDSVCRVVQDLAPNRAGPVVWDAAYVIELPAGTAASTGTRQGDQLELRRLDSKRDAFVHQAQVEEVEEATCRLGA